MQPTTILLTVSDPTTTSIRTQFVDNSKNNEAAFGSELTIIAIGLLLLVFGSVTFVKKLCKTLAVSANK